MHKTDKRWVYGIGPCGCVSGGVLYTVRPSVAVGGDDPVGWVGDGRAGQGDRASAEARLEH